MYYKLKQETVLSVSQSIGEAIADATFRSFSAVDGEQLLSLTHSRQVNAFIIRSLFNQWRKEVEKLESPYFDFNHARVKEALKAFMNVLSNHISINRVHLEPLLVQAVADTLLISFAPRQYLESVLKRVDNPRDFKWQYKYIKTNRDLFKELIHRTADFDTKAEMLQAYEAIDTSKTESIDAKGFLEKLNAQEKFAELFEEMPQVAKKVVKEEKHTEKPVKTKKEPLKTVQAITLNDRFDRQEKRMTLAEKLQRKPNQSIEASLTLNEKFMFQHNLFGGDNALMKEAFAHIEQAANLKEALDKATPFNNGWDMESEEVEAFMAVLEKRF